MTAFWASSNDARPLTWSTHPRSGTRSCCSAQPRTLSTALCRPTSSRTHSRSSGRGEQGRAVQPAGAREDALLRAEQVGQRCEQRRRHPDGVVVDRPAGRRADGVEAGLAADPAGAGGHEGALDGRVRGRRRPRRARRRRCSRPPRGSPGPPGGASSTGSARCRTPRRRRPRRAGTRRSARSRRPGVRMVTASARPSTRISSGSSTTSASARCSRRAPRIRRTRRRVVRLTVLPLSLGLFVCSPAFTGAWFRNSNHHE